MTLKGKFRVVNALFWTGIWVGIVYFTDSFREWIPMAAEAVVPIMLWGFIHIALRNEPDTPPGV